jgi:hypothetical protein
LDLQEYVRMALVLLRGSVWDVSGENKIRVSKNLEDYDHVHRLGSIPMGVRYHTPIFVIQRIGANVEDALLS